MAGSGHPPHQFGAAQHPSASGLLQQSSSAWGAQAATCQRQEERAEPLLKMLFAGQI